MATILASPNDFVARHSQIRFIELKRGSTLKLEHSAGATMRLVDDAAWVSGCRWHGPMRAGEPARLNGNGTILVHALADSSLCLEGVALRRRAAAARRSRIQRAPARRRPKASPRSVGDSSFLAVNERLPIAFAKHVTAIRRP
jgi:hypothetical protein